jgi:hypothetical protein
VWTYVVHLKTSTKKPSLDIGNSHNESSANANLIRSIFRASVDFQSVVELITFLGSEPADSGRSVGDDESEDDT